MKCTLKLYNVNNCGKFLNFYYSFNLKIASYPNYKLLEANHRKIPNSRSICGKWSIITWRQWILFHYCEFVDYISPLPQNAKDRYIIHFETGKTLGPKRFFCAKFWGKNGLLCKIWQFSEPFNNLLLKLNKLNFCNHYELLINL